MNKAIKRKNKDYSGIFKMYRSYFKVPVGAVRIKTISHITIIYDTTEDDSKYCYGDL